MNLPLKFLLKFLLELKGYLGNLPTKFLLKFLLELKGLPGEFTFQISVKISVKSKGDDLGNLSFKFLFNQDQGKNHVFIKTYTFEGSTTVITHFTTNIRLSYFFENLSKNSSNPNIQISVKISVKFLLKFLLNFC